MTTNEGIQHVRVVCVECSFSKVVERTGQTPASVIVDHGRSTGHKLTTEPVDAAD